MKPATTTLEIIDLGRMDYAEAFRFQETRVAARRSNGAPDALVLVEHDPVFTLGQGASEADIRWTVSEQARRQVQVVRTTRGGKVTYHGPGQVVGYPILRLGREAREAVRYVGRLEQVLIATLADFGLTAVADSRNRGVWIGNEKIAALGVKISGGVSLHGFALNVRVDLSYYAGIIPCGIMDKGVTSMHRFVPDIAPEQVKPVLVRRFKEVFNYDP